jgi:hypothetical protein
MSGEASPTVSWGPVLATTLMNYIDSGKFRDQAHSRSPLWKFLREGKRIKRLTGGERIKLPLVYEGSGNFKRYGGLEPLDVSGYDGVTNAFFNWKQAAVAAVISGLDSRNNQGENQVRDLWKTKIEQAEAEMGDNLATDAYSDGTATGSKQMAGLAAMIATTITSGTYADIDTAVNTKWRNQVQTSIGAAAVNLLPYLRTLYNDCTEVASVEGEPDALFTTQTLAEVLEALTLPAVRYVGGGEADLSTKPKYRNAKIYWEAKCQSGIGYLLNSNHLFMFVHKDADMSMLPAGKQQPVNQDAFAAPIIWQGNMACNLRAALGKFTGAT